MTSDHDHNLCADCGVLWVWTPRDLGTESQPSQEVIALKWWPCHLLLRPDSPVSAWWSAPRVQCLTCTESYDMIIYDTMIIWYADMLCIMPDASENFWVLNNPVGRVPTFPHLVRGQAVASNAALIGSHRIGETCPAWFLLPSACFKTALAPLHVFLLMLSCASFCLAPPCTNTARETRKANSEMMLDPCARASSQL